MPAHPLTNFETQRYHRNEPNGNARDSLYASDNSVGYFNSFSVEYY